MDQRETLHSGSSFLVLLQEAFARGEKVSIMYDYEGLDRAQGFITTLTDTALQLDTLPAPIPVAAVVAVNGLFRSDFSTC
jgi:hypothetical protein